MADRPGIPRDRRGGRSHHPVATAGDRRRLALPGPQPPVEPLLRVAQAMRIDNWTLDVVSALEAAGVRPILLKGPAIAEWLYDGDRRLRSYNDVDLLVAPECFTRAGDVLSGAGFRCDSPLRFGGRGESPAHAETWFRDLDHAAVDLHWCLHVTEACGAERVWSVLTRDTSFVEVNGVAVETLSEPARALHTVLHLTLRDGPGSQAWNDLRRAIERVPLPTWRTAGKLATDLGVRREAGALLRLVPGGSELADELGLPTTAPRRFVIEQDRYAPPAAHFLARASGRSMADVSVMVWKQLFPPPAHLRTGEEQAGRGRRSLLVGYGRRLLLVPGYVIDLVHYLRSGRADRLRTRT